MPPPSVVLPTSIPTSKQPGKYKKRAFADTQDISEEEEDDDDIDMNISDNDSSGSDVDSDRIPAKRLRTSTIITRSSRTPASEGSIAEATNRHRSPSSTSDHTSHLDNPGTEPEPEPEPESGIPGADVDMPLPSAHTTPTNDATSDTTPATPHHPSTIGMDIDKPGILPQPPSSPSAPGPDSKLKIPDFLNGKYDIYGYLSSTKESKFRDLLDKYIRFEHTVKVANPPYFRGNLTTARRPKGVGWWSSRARTDRLPPYDSLGSFAKSVVEWWAFIQPDWCRIQPGKVSRVGGDWTHLFRPGVNGLLNVVILAHWWARILEERDCTHDETYSWFVSDVTWVLSQLTVVAREGGV